MKIRMSGPINRFGLSLASMLVDAGDPGENLFISPSSLTQTLLMTLNGAGGSTLSNMARVLDVAPEFLDNYNLANKSLLSSWKQADPRVKLAVANALFVRNGYQLYAKFLARCGKYYGAEVQFLDFLGDPGGSLNTMNNWVKTNTDEMIPFILTDEPGRRDVVFLVNAVGFDGQWTTAFDPKAIKPRIFKSVSGDKELPFMLQQGRYPYAETNDFQVVSLPYGDNGRYCMDIVLPKQSVTPSDLLTHFVVSGKDWMEWGSPQQSTKGTILLPRFELECSYKLNQVLSDMGMSVAFSETTADFSEMVAPPESIFISRVLHKTKLQVNEKGTKAAAATVVGGTRTTSVDPSRPFYVEVNRPFICAIRDTESGALHFVGIINNPK